MTTEQVSLIKKTWKVFRSISPKTVGDLFYSKLFADNPSLRRMFPDDMEQQYNKLIDMLNAFVMRLDRLDEFTEEIKAMAQRHEQYGIRPAHYKLVGRALLWTLQKGLGDDWNTEIKNAWVTCYKTLADTMIDSCSLANVKV